MPLASFLQPHRLSTRILSYTSKKARNGETRSDVEWNGAAARLLSLPRAERMQYASTDTMFGE